MTRKPFVFGLAVAGGLAAAMAATAGDFATDSMTTGSTQAGTMGSTQAGPPSGEQKIPPGYYVPPGVTPFEDRGQRTRPGYSVSQDDLSDEEQKIPPGYYRPAPAR